ncbi:hypothetical protein OUZ56_001980 [Daphnia magna]|uniref:Uncharacterized protein n=1 Tax=Daphnia magna TaxID=35525 RepID=A0ABR0A4B0_9CRUS|nr:hypothetical protein OUZ56_001980 [Daphnia magna]
MDDGGNDVMKPIDAAHSVNLTPALSYQRKDGQSAINKVAACAYITTARTNERIVTSVKPEQAKISFTGP